MQTTTDFTILKSQYEGKDFKIRGVASTEVYDQQGDLLKLDKLDLSKIEGRLGMFKWEHARTSNNYIGIVTKAEVRGKQLYVEGVIWGDTDEGRKAIQLMKALERSGHQRKVQMSIEGDKVARKSGGVVESWRLGDIALTMAPVNSETYAELAKSNLRFDQINLDEKIRVSVDNENFISVDEYDPDKQPLTKSQTLDIIFSKFTTDAEQALHIFNKLEEKMDKSLTKEQMEHLDAYFDAKVAEMQKSTTPVNSEKETQEKAASEIDELKKSLAEAKEKAEKAAKELEDLKKSKETPAEEPKEGKPSVLEMFKSMTEEERAGFKALFSDEKKEETVEKTLPATKEEVQAKVIAQYLETHGEKIQKSVDAVWQELNKLKAEPLQKSQANVPVIDPYADANKDAKSLSDEKDKKEVLGALLKSLEDDSLKASDKKACSVAIQNLQVDAGVNDTAREILKSKYNIILK